MRNQRTLPQQAIRADRRFDELVKKEKEEHQHLLSSHNKEMQALRNQLSLAMERFEALFQKSDGDLKDFKNCSASQIGTLKMKIDVHEAASLDHRKSVEDLSRQLHDFQDSHPNKDDVQKIKQGIEARLDSATANQIVLLQDMQRDVKSIVNGLKDDLIGLKGEVDRRFSECTEKGENNFQLSRLDKEGIERELSRYKQTVFYIEKKIENIYTLIDRINKRGEPCHKPEQ